MQINQDPCLTVSARQGNRDKCQTRRWQQRNAIDCVIDLMKKALTRLTSQKTYIMLLEWCVLQNESRPNAHGHILDEASNSRVDETS